MKKIVSLLLAMMMVIAMAAGAMAESIVNNTSGHTYDAYQVFSGTQAANNTALGDIVWGNGVDGVGLLAELVKNDAFKDCTSAEDVANVLVGKSYDSAEAKLLANLAVKFLTENKTEISGDTVTLATGYYLLLDKTDVSGAHDAKNTALLQVTNDVITINKKYNVPSVDKDITKAGTDETFAAGIEGADAEIGDAIEFTLTGTLPSNYADYDTYKYVFHDTLSAGLTYNGDAKVYVDAVTAENEITSHFTFVPNAAQTTGGGMLTVTCENLKTITDKEITASSKIIVVYTATLNAEAKIGADGNPNEVYLEFSNNPNYNGEGDNEPTGNTPEDKVIVFTYELDVTKVDGTNAEIKLENAQFVLLNTEKNKVATVVNGVLTGWVDVPDAVDGKITWPENTTLVSGADGKFIIKGLDADTYYLRETVAPAGYNLLTSDIQIVITADVNAEEGNETTEGELDELKIDVTVNGKTTSGEGDKSTGIVNANVENKQGATLPETGGMGTTMMYIGGGLLVAFAVIMLATKRRMNAAE